MCSITAINHSLTICLLAVGLGFEVHNVRGAFLEGGVSHFIVGMSRRRGACVDFGSGVNTGGGGGRLRLAGQAA